jgi:hypothetical protein
MMAWVDLLIIANHASGFYYKRGVKVEVLRGQVGYGLETLAKRWKWSRNKIERYFIELEKDNQIVRQKNNVTSLISIINYEFYQSEGNAEGKPSETADGQQKVKQTETNKKNKKKKNEKKFMPPTLDEVKTYFRENGYSEPSADKAFKYYEAGNWRDSENKPVKSWKQKMHGVWFKDENKINKTETSGLSKPKGVAIPQ